MMRWFAEHYDVVLALLPWVLIALLVAWAERANRQADTDEDEGVVNLRERKAREWDEAQQALESKRPPAA